MSDLLEQFITEECTTDVRRLIEDALADSANARPRFEFNRFEVTIDRDTNVVLVEDVLDATKTGAARVSLAEFQAALKHTRST